MERSEGIGNWRRDGRIWSHLSLPSPQHQIGDFVKFENRFLDERCSAHSSVQRNRKPERGNMVILHIVFLFVL